MEENRSTQHIKLDQLLAISRGDRAKMLGYLQQFMELVPARLEEVTKNMVAKDRDGTWKVLHTMMPQLSFFGLGSLVEYIRQLEVDHREIPLSELDSIVGTIKTELEAAMEEIKSFIQSISE